MNDEDDEDDDCIDQDDDGDDDLGTLMKCRTVLLGHASNRRGWTNKLPQALPLSRSAASYDYLPSLKNKMDKQTK